MEEEKWRIRDIVVGVILIVIVGWFMITALQSCIQSIPSQPGYVTEEELDIELEEMVPP